MNKRKKKRNGILRAIIVLYDKHNKWPVPTAKEAKERSLGQWISRCRFFKNHSPEKLIGKQIRLIDRIDADKIRKKTEQWQNNYNNLKIFLEKEQRWPSSSASDPLEIKLSNWCATQKITRKNTPKTKQNKGRIKLLDDIGFNWYTYNKRRSWKESFNLVRDYYNNTGRWPAHTRDQEESRLAKWCSKMRAYKNGKDTSVTLTPRQIKKLTDLGFDWSDSQSSNGRSPERLEKIWIERYHEFSEFITNEKRYPRSRTGTESEKEESLYSWWMRMGYLRRRGKLSSERIQLLDRIGFRWGKENE